MSTNTLDINVDGHVNFHLENYDGPLDLLIDLIKNKKMDIFDIDLSILAIEYVKVINQLKNDDINLASEYLVMAADLIQLKARMLLLSPENEELEEDKAELINKIAEYHRFKQIALLLREKEIRRKDLHTKNIHDLKPFESPVDETRLDGASNPVKLIMILRKMFERTHATQLRQAVVKNVNISPKERVEEIKRMLETKSELSFEEVFKVPSLSHFVVTMLALLDLARLQVIKLEQDDQFDKIRIRKGVLINE